MCWIAVEVAEVFHVHGTCVVMHRAVVVSIGELQAQTVRQPQLLGNLFGRVSVIRQAEGLIVNVFVHIPLFFEKFDRRLAAPDGPVVAGELYVQPVSEKIDRLVDLIRPRQRVAYLCAARGVHVVQVVRGDLGHAQGFELRKIENHFRGCLGTRGHLKLDVDTVNRAGFAGIVDDVVRYHETGGAHAERGAQSRGDETGW